MTRKTITAMIAALATSAALLTAFDDASARGFRGGAGFRGAGFSHRAAMPRMARPAMPRANRMAMPRTNRAAMPRVNRGPAPRIARPVAPQRNLRPAPRINSALAARLGRPNVPQLNRGPIGPRVAPANAARVAPANQPRVQPANQGRPNQPAKGALPRVNLAKFDAARPTGNTGNRTYAQMGPTTSTTPTAPAAPRAGGMTPRRPATPADKQRLRQKVISIREAGWRLDARLRAIWQFDDRVRQGARANPPLSSEEQRRIDDAGGTEAMIWANKLLMENVIIPAIDQNNAELKDAEDEAHLDDAWRE
jgi:hypothetical protein